MINFKQKAIFIVHMFAGVVALIVLFFIVRMANRALFSSTGRLDTELWNGSGSKEDP